jgi:hypothetical protein
MIAQSDLGPLPTYGSILVFMKGVDESSQKANTKAKLHELSRAIS